MHNCRHGSQGRVNEGRLPSSSPSQQALEEPAQIGLRRKGRRRLGLGVLAIAARAPIGARLSHAEKDLGLYERQSRGRCRRRHGRTKVDGRCRRRFEQPPRQQRFAGVRGQNGGGEGVRGRGRFDVNLVDLVIVLFVVIAVAQVERVVLSGGADDVFVLVDVTGFEVLAFVSPFAADLNTDKV